MAFQRLDPSNPAGYTPEELDQIAAFISKLEDEKRAADRLAKENADRIYMSRVSLSRMEEAARQQGLSMMQSTGGWQLASTAVWDNPAYISDYLPSSGTLRVTSPMSWSTGMYQPSVPGSYTKMDRVAQQRKSLLGQYTITRIPHGLKITSGKMYRMNEKILLVRFKRI